MFVFVQVSSMKTRRSTGSWGWIRCHQVRPILLAGVQRFFEADPRALQEAPQRIAGDHDVPLLGQLVEKGVQREIGLLPDAGEQPIALLAAVSSVSRRSKPAT